MIVRVGYVSVYFDVLWMWCGGGGVMWERMRD